MGQQYGKTRGLPGSHADDLAQEMCIRDSINAKYEKGAESVLPADPSAHTPVGTPLSAGEEKVFEYARTHGAVTRNEVMGLLEVCL